LVGGGYFLNRYTEAQVIGALKQLEASRKAKDVAREVGVSKHTIYAWKAKYGGMDVLPHFPVLLRGNLTASAALHGIQRTV
jgi:hypothetical protein